MILTECLIWSDTFLVNLLKCEHFLDINVIGSFSVWVKLYVNTFKYHVSCTDGKISVRIDEFFLHFFTVVPFNGFLSCRPFIVITTFLRSCLMLKFLLSPSLDSWQWFELQLSTAQARRQKKLQRRTRPFENVISKEGLQERKHNYWMGRR